MTNLIYQLFRLWAYSAVILTTVKPSQTVALTVAQPYAGIPVNLNLVGACTPLLTSAPMLNEVSPYENQNKFSSLGIFSNIYLRVGGYRTACKPALETMQLFEKENPLYQDIYQFVLSSPEFRFILDDYSDGTSDSFHPQTNQITLSKRGLTEKIFDKERIIHRIRHEMLHAFFHKYARELKKLKTDHWCTRLFTEEANRNILDEIKNSLQTIKELINRSNDQSKELKQYFINNDFENNYNVRFHGIFYNASTHPDVYKQIVRNRVEHNGATKKIHAKLLTDFGIDISRDYDLGIDKYNPDVTVVYEAHDPGKVYEINYKFNDPLLNFYIKLHERLLVIEENYRKPAWMEEKIIAIAELTPVKMMEKYFPILFNKLKFMVDEMKNHEGKNNKKSALTYPDGSFTSGYTTHTASMNDVVSAMDFPGKSFCYFDESIIDNINLNLENLKIFMFNRDQILQDSKYKTLANEFLMKLTSNQKWIEYVKNNTIKLNPDNLLAQLEKYDESYSKTNLRLKP